MPVERASGGSSLIDVLDRVLDKGIVIDAWVRVSLVGIDLITVEARVVVASIDTYLKYSEAVGQAPAVAPKGIDAKTHEALLAENAALKASTIRRGAVSLKVSEKGGVSVYGLGRFPVTLYKEQWAKLLDLADEIRAFIKAHDAELKSKPQ